MEGIEIFGTSWKLVASGGGFFLGCPLFVTLVRFSLFKRLK